jgi:putative hydrolase of the HAD superfamily
MTKIDTVLFDWGGVLIEDPAPGLMAYCAQALGVSVPDYTQAHQRHSGPFQTGRIAEDRFWQQICVTLNCDLPPTESLWGEAFRNVYKPRRDMFDLAASLKEQGIKTAVLSNTERPAVAYFLEKNYTVFDHAIFSCAEGCQKPDPEIYAIAVARCRTIPQQSLLIDDQRDFIQGARNAGLEAVLFGHPKETIVALHQRFHL